MSKKNLLSFNKAQIASVIFFLFAAVLFYLCTRLFFYDEDIFVANSHSNFMKDLTRTAIVKINFLLDNFFYKTNSTGYHITNILLHLANTFLATYTFRILLNSVKIKEIKISKTSYIFFFLFLLSPVHSEPLCYILGRAGLIVTLFCTLSFLFFLKANFKNWRLLLVSLLFFLLALFSYEISWIFPVIILLAAFYFKITQNVKSKAIIAYVIPYFVLFFLWFLIKIIFIDKLKITPYGNSIFLSFDIPALIKNFIVLFFRNIIPPFKSTAFFISLSVIAGILIIYFLLSSGNRSKQLLIFLWLIILIWLSAFLPALVFGINSHTSESERYIYFSSVFAIMFVATALSLLPSKAITIFVVIIICFIYSGVLFSTINNYIRGGNFSKSYLSVLRRYNSGKNVYLINQPSQYSGALLFRALSDEKQSSAKKFYTIKDYMHTLYNAKANYITLSKKEILKNDAIANVIVTSIDSLTSVFSEYKFDKSRKFLINTETNESVFFEETKSIIVGLKLPATYIFK